MARKPMVTRTLTTTKAVALCLNVTTCEPFNETITLPRVYKDDKKLLEALKEAVETDDIKVVHVVSVEHKDTIYGMLELEFMEHAVELDPETRKPVEKESETESEV